MAQAGAEFDTARIGCGKLTGGVWHVIECRDGSADLIKRGGELAEDQAVAAGIWMVGRGIDNECSFYEPELFNVLARKKLRVSKARFAIK